ncbi:MAG: hypothetical protein Kow0047_11860 [Anaerolineae bacterium]
MDWTAFWTGTLLIILFAILMWPERGLYFRWARRRRIGSRETIEDALMHIHQREHEGPQATLTSLAKALEMTTSQARRLVARLTEQGLIRQEGDALRLTPDGHAWAIQVVRAHRLFERFLADETDVQLEEIHELAHRLEHQYSPEQLDKLEADLGYPAVDPHGDPIPRPDEDLPEPTGQPLTEWPEGKTARIVHIEDEPPIVFAQIVAAGLRPGAYVQVLERTPERLTIEVDASDHAVLAPALANNIFVDAVPRPVPPVRARRLSELRLGERARVKGLAEHCQGLTRRRFLDLGITPGTIIEPVMQSTFREPTAYRVRDTLIALRREQADMILIESNGAEP